MTLNQFRYFYEVCKWNSVTKAAAELIVSQPTVSSSIQSLEKELNLRLFVRQSNRLYLTPAGETVRMQVGEILKSVDALVQNAEKMPAASIALCASPVVSVLCFNPIFREFAKRNPHIHLDIREHGSLEAMKLLSQEKTDLAVLLLNDTINESFSVVPLATTSIVYTVNAQHIMAKKSSCTIKDLKDESFILMNADNYQTAASILDRFQKEEINPNIYLTLSQLYLINKIIRETPIGAFLIKDFLRSEKDLVGIPLDPPIELTIGLVWNKKAKLRGEVMDFITFARDHGREISWEQV